MFSKIHFNLSRRSTSLLSRGSLRSLATSPSLTKRATPLFPYGEKEFKQIREREQFFVDNTRFIPMLEEVGKKLFFVRPPRFGKSLFVDMLAHYYDCSTSLPTFNSLFSGLDVHSQVTKSARSYHVLHLDFTFNVAGDYHQNFANAVNTQLKSFSCSVQFAV